MKPDMVGPACKRVDDDARSNHEAVVFTFAALVEEVLGIDALRAGHHVLLKPLRKSEPDASSEKRTRKPRGHRGTGGELPPVP